MRLTRLRFESKYLTIKYFYEEKKWSIAWMCRQFKITRAAYYKWLHREIPHAELENRKLAALIKTYDEIFKHTMGYRRMTVWLNSICHTRFSKNRIYRIMAKLRITSAIRRKKRKYVPNRADEAAENILSRDFYAAAPNQKWVTDITEFKVPGTNRKIHLSVIMDLYDRYPVAYEVSCRNDTRLVFETFDKALAANPEASPIFHSDRGFQYTNSVFKRMLREHNMKQSMSRVGHCIDNGPIEGFWGIMKTEMYQMYEISDEASLRQAIKEYIRFYSEERLQERYHGKTPLEVRHEALASREAPSYPIPENKRIQKFKAKWEAHKNACTS